MERACFPSVSAACTSTACIAGASLSVHTWCVMERLPPSAQRASLPDFRAHRVRGFVASNLRRTSAFYDQGSPPVSAACLIFRGSGGGGAAAVQQGPARQPAAALRLPRRLRRRRRLGPLACGVARVGCGCGATKKIVYKCHEIHVVLFLDGVWGSGGGTPCKEILRASSSCD